MKIDNYTWINSWTVHRYWSRSHTCTVGRLRVELKLRYDRLSLNVSCSFTSGWSVQLDSPTSHVAAQCFEIRINYHRASQKTHVNVFAHPSLAQNRARKGFCGGFTLSEIFCQIHSNPTRCSDWTTKAQHTWTSTSIQKAFHLISLHFSVVTTRNWWI